MNVNVHHLIGMLISSLNLSGIINIYFRVNALLINISKSYKK